MNTSSNFEKDSIWSLIAKNGIPFMLTMVIVIIYNLADTFFVGQTHNDMMVAAVSVAAPIFTLLITVGTLIGSGGCSIISRAMGCNDKDTSKHTSSFCFYISIFIGIIFALLLLIGCEPILYLIGATDNTIHLASVYLRIIAVGSPFIIFSNTMANVIRADGAAVATVVGNICASIYYILFLRKKNSDILSCSIDDFTWNRKISLPVFSIGLPGALGNLLMSVSNIIMNLFLVPYGDGSVAAMGVAMKVSMIVAMLQMGLCMGVLPILAYNFGANNRKICCFTTSHFLVSAFVTDNAIIDLGVKMVKAIILSGPILGIYFLTTNIMQAAGKALVPTIVSLSRQGIIYIPGLILLNALFGLDGLIYTQAVSDILAAIMSIILCIFVLRKYFSKNS